MSTLGHERTYRNRWLDAGVYVVSIVLACVVVFYLPSDYRVSGGVVGIIFVTLALVFRFLFWFILGRAIEKRGHQQGNENHVA